MGSIGLRRARRESSLAASVIRVLDDLQCPVSTTAVRVVLTAHGRAVTAEQLGRLAAYQREDFLRTRYPPELCWALQPDGTPTTPRWWARGEWRVERRIATGDVRPIWIATLAERLCLDLAQRPRGSDEPIAQLALSAAAEALGGRYFNVPTSDDDWVVLREQVYGRYMGAFSNRAGATSDQAEAEVNLQAQGLSGFELLFGRSHE